MRNATQALVILIMIGLMAFPVLAQESGGYAGSILRYGVGGRAMGMGRACVAVADDARGVYWNPAGILGSGRIELTSMYSNLYYDSEYSHVGIVFPRPLQPRNAILRFLFGPPTAHLFPCPCSY